MVLEALIFDLDGTLAETEELHRQAFNDTFSAAGLSWHWQPDLYRSLLQTAGGRERMRRYRDDLGASGPSNAEIAILQARKTARYADLVAAGDLSPRLGVPELIRDARAAGLRLAIATTTSRANVDTVIQSLWSVPATDLFEAVVAGDDVAAKKPAPDVYLLALDRLGISEKDAIAFEDSSIGLHAALAAGLRTIVVPSTFTRDDEFRCAEQVVPDLCRRHLPPDLARRLGEA